MAALTEALKNLKKDLESIAQRPMAHQSVSEKDASAKLPYSDRLIQSLWELADNSLTLEEDSAKASYLNQEIQLPKIVDRNSAKTGAALLRLLNTLTAEQKALGIIPTISATMAALLEDQMSVYADLEEANNRAVTAYNELQASAKDLLACEKNRKIFLDEQLDPALRELNAAYAQPLDDLQKQIEQAEKSLKASSLSLEQLQLNLKNRRDFLEAAAAKLKSFKTILVEHTGLYVPAQKIPQQELIDLLECPPEVVEAIKKIYDTEQAGSSWFGLNLTNIKNKYNHATTLFGPSDFDLDISGLQDIITKRLEIIAVELRLDALSEPEEVLPHLAELNLYNLSRFLQKTEEQFSQNKESLEKLQQAHEKLALEKNQRLMVLQEKNAEWDQNVAQVLLNNHLRKINHALAMLALKSKHLGYQLSGLKQRQGKLEQLIDDLTKQPGLQAQELYESNLEEYSNFENSLNAKNEYKGLSAAELAKTLDSDIRRLAKLQSDAESIATHIKSCPVELREQLSAMNLELESLIKQRASLNESILALTQSLPETKILFDRLGQLTQIHGELSLLLEKSKLQQLHKKEKRRLIETSELAIARYASTLSDMSALPNLNPAISVKLASIHSLINSDDGLLEFIALSKLHRVKSKYQALQEQKIELAKRKASYEESDFLADRIELAVEEYQDLREQYKMLAKVQAKCREIDSIQDDLQEFRKNRYIYVPQTKRVKDTFVNDMKSLTKAYFGPHKTRIGGFFGKYLQERAVTFASYDMISMIIAACIGFLGYKTEATKREKYLTDLSKLIREYEEGEDDDIYNEIKATIAFGKRNFAPRAQEGYEGYEKSLYAKLSMMELRFERINENRLKFIAQIEADDEAINEVFTELKAVITSAKLNFIPNANEVSKGQYKTQLAQLSTQEARFRCINMPRLMIVAQTNARTLARIYTELKVILASAKDFIPGSQEEKTEHKKSLLNKLNTLEVEFERINKTRLKFSVQDEAEEDEDEFSASL